MNIPGAEKPIQPLEVLYGGAYAQDEWRPASNVTVTAGIRMDIPFFEDTGFANAEADARTFRDENGQPVQYQSGELPDASILWSPRVGINWDVNGNARTQVRGGTGVFTGRPAYVWISNQIGNTGVLTGFEELNNTTAPAVQPRSEPLQADHAADRRACGQLRAGADQSRFQVPADLALEHRRRSPAAGPLHAHWRVPLQQGRQRHLLHQRQPAGGADRVRRSGQSAAMDNNRIYAEHPQRCGAEEPERRAARGTPPSRSRASRPPGCPSAAATATTCPRTRSMPARLPPGPGTATRTPAIPTTLAFRIRRRSEGRWGTASLRWSPITSEFSASAPPAFALLGGRATTATPATSSPTT